MTTLYRWEGKILRRGENLATHRRCCCGVCDCCLFDPETAAVTQFNAVWISAENGLPQGILKESGVATLDGETCTGRIYFTVEWDGGSICQAKEVTQCYAQLNWSPGCCYWTVNLTRPQDPCLDPYVGIDDGWPGDLMLSPGCSGFGLAANCAFYSGTDCEPFCDLGGFVNVSFTTSLGGQCLPCEDETVI